MEQSLKFITLIAMEAKQLLLMMVKNTVVECLPRTFFPFHSGQKTGELLFHTDVQTCHLFSSGWPGNGRNGHFLQTEPMAQFLVEPKYTTDLYAHRTSQ